MGMNESNQYSAMNGITAVPYEDDILANGTDGEAVGRNLAFLEAVLAMAGAMIMVFDHDGRVVRFNHALEQLTGFSFEQVRGKIFWEFFPLPDTVDNLRQEFARRLDGRIPTNYETDYLAQDGTRHLIAFTSTVLRDAQNHAEYVIATGIDITVRRDAEQLLVAQKRVLEMIARGAPLPKVLGEVCAMVEAHLRGVMCSILLLDKPSQTLHHGAAPSLPLAYRQAIDGLPIGPRAGSCGTAAFLEKPVIVVDIASDPLWKEYRDCALVHGLRACWSTPITATEGEVVATFAIYYPEPHQPTPAELNFVQQTVVPLAGIVIERKMAEEALKVAHADQTSLAAQLRQSRDALRTLFDGMSDGLLLLQHEGVILVANQAAAAMLGMTPHTLVLMPWQQLCAEPHVRFLDEFVQTSFRDGQPRHRREQYQRPGVASQVLDIQALPLLDEAGVVEQMIVHLVDSTEQVQLEALAIQNEREAASGRLAATIAHDINTPLQSIKNCLYLAAHAEENKRATYMQVASEELDRISGVVRQMLHLYRTHSSQQVPVELNCLLNRVLLLLGSTMEERMITVEQQFAAQVPMLWGYPDQLTQVFLNLLLNA
ncbi:MAG: PAS domain S-box protein, partial [Herpetosiphonaceae bacterium]|nr:PAS domain S-box protein [Herpetosiphonaceae bacterium]